jgi:hypothetical protein
VRADDRAHVERAEDVKVAEAIGALGTARRHEAEVDARALRVSAVGVERGAAISAGNVRSGSALSGSRRACRDGTRVKDV